MQIKLTGKEIAENHNVSERTAYRWLADNDPRCFVEIYEEPAEVRERRESEQYLRRVLTELADVSEDLGRWAAIWDDSPLLPKLAPLKTQLFQTMTALQRESGLFPGVEWNEE